MKDLLRELYFGFIAILMLSELFAGNIYSLYFNIERPAELMAVSIEVAYRHMTILSMLDAIVGIGACMVIWSIWSTKKRKVATNIISYKRYREILFQKVALCYLLHFVQDGSSKNALEN